MTTRNRPEALELAEELTLRLLEKFPLKEDKKRSTYFTAMDGLTHEIPPVQDAEIALEMTLRAAHWLAGADIGGNCEPPDLTSYLG